MFSFEYKKLDFSHKLGTASFPEDDFGKHIHYFYEIVYFVNGNVTYSVESESRDLETGNLILIKPGQVHFATVNDDETYERYVLKFPETILPDYLKEKLSTIGPFFYKTRTLSYIFEKLDDYVKRYNQDEVHTLFECELLRLCVFISNELSLESHNTNPRILEILEYIDANIDGDLSVKTISDLFNYNISYISHEFKKVMRVSIFNYVRSKRVFYAHQLILNGTKTQDAAIKAGFYDYSTFYRSYIKVMGCKPADHNV